ncbi:MAG: hypothetical protein ACRDEB_09740, partial [Chitinophagaceae bacterium]
MSSIIQNKVLNYEVTPPAGVWERITKALDESEMNLEFPSMLYNAEVIPPDSAWEKVSSFLDTEKKIIPVQRKISFIVKYAAAAVLIGLLAWGGIQILNNRSGKREIAKQQTTSPEKDKYVPTTEPLIEISEEKAASAANTTLNDEVKNDEALEASKKTYAKLDVSTKRRIKEIAAGYSFAASINNISPIIPEDEINPGNPSSRYILLMTPEGNIIRMSKKLTDMVCCLSGEDEDPACKDQIKKWREKIICSPSC